MNHGFSMLDELVGHKSFMQIVILNATGRLVEKRLADWVEAAYGCLSWPDPRIWCNQVGALAGQARTTVTAAATAGVLAADSRAYGQRTIVGGIEFIQSSLRDHLNGMSIEEIVSAEVVKSRGKPSIVGYARPIAKGDERIVAMQRVTEKLGFAQGRHMELAMGIESLLLKEYQESMNINGYVSAFLSDQGFAAEETYAIFSVLVFSGVVACFVEYQNKPVNSFLPLRCDDIAYCGPEDRSVID